MIHSYPWYIADWRGSEAVLDMNLEEKGLYRELLDHTWERGSLPVDESLLQKISAATTWEFKRSWPKVKAQFYERDGRLYHVKVDEKRPDLEEWHDSRREAGRKGAEKRWGTKSNSSANSSAIAELKPSSSSSSSSSSTHKEEPPTPPFDLCAPDGARVIALAPVNGNGAHPEWFEQWWKIYWRKVSRKPAEKAFLAHVKTPERFEVVMAATRTQTPAMMAREPDHRPHGATWLNAERWNDQPSTPARASPNRKPTVVENVERVIQQNLATKGKPW